MKKIIAWLLVLALTAAISIGATLAYLTDTDEDVNVMTVGKVKIDQLEYERVSDETSGEDALVQEFHDNKPLYPGVYNDDFKFTDTEGKVDWTQIGKDDYTTGIWDPATINNELDKMVFVKNKGNYDAFVRTVFAFEAGNYETVSEFLEMVHLNLNTTNWSWDWLPTPVTIGQSDYFVAVATYNEILEPGALTEISLSQIALDKTATNADVEAFGDTYQILVKTQAIQADGFTEPAAALDEGFSPIDEANVPWESDSPTKGGALMTALHNDPDGNVITTAVNAIVFGKNADYPEIVNNYKGYLVDVDQDVPAYVYYVEGKTKAANGYTLYVLSNDTIYAPEDSTALFKGMTDVTTIDARNLDVSRVQNATFMFRDCTKLQKLDATGWDTSNITNMQGLFYKCNALTEIVGIKDWDVSNVTTLYAAFYNLHAMTELDLSGWKTSSMENLGYVIANNNNLETINLTGWDWSNVTNSIYAFRANPKLKNLVGSGDWYMPKNTDMYSMFQNNTALVSLDVSKWDTGSCTRYHDLFVGCTALETIIGLENWNTGSGTNFISLFNGCSSLKNIGDLSSWDMSKAYDTGYMFYGCKSLTEIKGITNWNTESLELLTYMFGACTNLISIDLSGWDVSNITILGSMFSSNSQNTGTMKLQSVNLSGWNPVNATHVGWMFYGCGNLTHVDLSGWSAEKITTMSHMFADCYKLESVDFTGWNTKSLICMDGIFNDCHAMKTVDMSMFDTSNVKEFSQTFEACKALEKVIGMENWDTSSACTFTEMFSGCGALKELDLSNFDTSNAFDNYTDMNDSTSHAFESMFSGVNSLEKLVVSDDIVYLGNGNVSESRKLVFPNPVAKEGYTAKWQNVETGELFLGKEIPEGVAATYVPYYEYIAKGASIYNALNYLNADSTGTKLTTKVTSVTFGLTEDYADITNNYPGVMADVGQERPVYAYYVPNGSNYDIYVLSSDTIYAPTDCSNLCNGMSNLVSFDTSNLDFSKTTSMYRMLRDCGKLTQIDVSDWNTANVTNMHDLFRGCKSVTELDVSNWETGKVTTMLAMFQDCVLITELDLNNWDVSNVTTVQQMFNRCIALEVLHIENWKPQSLSTGTTMFQSCTALKELDLSGWDTSSMTLTSGMFNHCESITYLNVSTWDMSHVTDTSLMFQACYKLENLDLSKWNTSSMININSMFFEDASLKALNVGSWDVSKVSNFQQMFVGCVALEKIEGMGNWSTSSGTNFGNFLNACTSLKELDLTKFNTAKATDLEGFFTSLSSLQKLTVGENFSCDANGKLGSGKKTTFPAPAKVEGSDGKWYNIATGEAYAPSEIPQGAATYVAVAPSVEP